MTNQPAFYGFESTRRDSCCKCSHDFWKEYGARSERREARGERRDGERRDCGDGSCQRGRKPGLQEKYCAKLPFSCHPPANALIGFLRKVHVATGRGRQQATGCRCLPRQEGTLTTSKSPPPLSQPGAMLHACVGMPFSPHRNKAWPRQINPLRNHNRPASKKRESNTPTSAVAMAPASLASSL